jgi:hypothetical protein
VYAVYACMYSVVCNVYTCSPQPGVWSIDQLGWTLNGQGGPGLALASCGYPRVSGGTIDAI